MRIYKVKFINDVVLLLLCLLLLHGCSSGSEKYAAKPAAIEEKRPAMHSIEMVQMKFYPAELKVRKGDKIVFVNHDIVAHDVTEESKKAWNSSPMSEGQPMGYITNCVSLKDFSTSYNSKKSPPRKHFHHHETNH